MLILFEVLKAYHQGIRKKECDYKHMSKDKKEKGTANSMTIPYFPTMITKRNNN